MDITSNSPYRGLTSLPYENLIFHNSQWVCHQRTATSQQPDLQVLILPTEQLPKNWKPHIHDLCATLSQPLPKKGYLSITLQPDLLLLEMYPEPFRLRQLGRFVPRLWGLSLTYGNQLSLILQRTGLMPATFDPRTWKAQSPAIKAHRSWRIFTHTLLHHRTQQQKATDLQRVLQAADPNLQWNPPLPPLGLGHCPVLTLLNKTANNPLTLSLHQHPRTYQVCAQLNQEAYVDIDNPLQFGSLLTTCAFISYGC